MLRILENDGRTTPGWRHCRIYRDRIYLLIGPCCKNHKKNCLVRNLDNRKKKGWPKIQCIQEVEEDLRTMGVRNWKTNRCQTRWQEASNGRSQRVGRSNRTCVTEYFTIILLWFCYVLTSRAIMKIVMNCPYIFSEKFHIHFYKEMLAEVLSLPKDSDIFPRSIYYNVLWPNLWCFTSSVMSYHLFRSVSFESIWGRSTIQTYHSLRRIFISLSQSARQSSLC